MLSSLVLIVEVNRSHHKKMPKYVTVCDDIS